MKGCWTSYWIFCFNTSCLTMKVYRCYFLHSNIPPRYWMLTTWAHLKQTLNKWKWNILKNTSICLCWKHCWQTTWPSLHWYILEGGVISPAQHGQHNSSLTLCSTSLQLFIICSSCLILQALFFSALVISDSLLLSVFTLLFSSSSLCLHLTFSFTISSSSILIVTSFTFLQTCFASSSSSLFLRPSNPSSPLQ